mgnify:CR=1 FL=1
MGDRVMLCGKWSDIGNGYVTGPALDDRSGCVTILEALNEVSKSGVYPWIDLDIDAQKGTFVSYPERADVTDLADIKEQLVVELYSK